MAVAIGSAGTGASLTAPSPSGRPCCHDGGGVPPCAVVPGLGAPGAGAWAAGACAAGAGGLTIGCEPGPPPGCASRDTGGCAGGDGLTAGDWSCCCAVAGLVASRPPASVARRIAREYKPTSFMLPPSGALVRLTVGSEYPSGGKFNRSAKRGTQILD